jgi:hypothetical protein
LRSTHDAVEFMDAYIKDLSTTSILGHKEATKLRRRNRSTSSSGGGPPINHDRHHTGGGTTGPGEETHTPRPGATTDDGDQRAASDVEDDENGHRQSGRSPAFSVRRSPAPSLDDVRLD